MDEVMIMVLATNGMDWIMVLVLRYQIKVYSGYGACDKWGDMSVLAIDG